MSDVVLNPSAQAQEQEVEDCVRFLEIEHDKFMYYTILLEEIEECLEEDNNLDPDLRAKVKNIILNQQVSESMLGNEPLLGLPPSSQELTHFECSQLSSCLDQKFAKKSERKNLKPEPQNEDAMLMDYLDKLNTEQQMYLQNKSDFLQLLEQLKDIRLTAVPRLAEENYQESSRKSRVNFLKSQLAKSKCCLDIFTESSNSLEAYTAVLKDMKEQERELVLEIQKLKDLKKKYDNVHCKEYEDILTLYLQYKSCLEKKKLMFK